ncbi:MAG: type II secretion system F family protein [Dehalococcoidales bacterium]|nr:type II secretion system F family protein [Dehalococcoidales bacterium]
MNAATEEAAVNLLDYAGYRVVNLKGFAPFLSSSRFSLRSSKTKPAEIILLYRQLALLLESGLDIVTALELLRVQISNRVLKKVLNDIITDLRSGNSLSSAMEKHPKVFSQLSRQSIRVGERAGGIESILRQIADYMQKEQAAAKGIKGALTYPIIASIATVIVVIVLVGFVLPTFSKLYESMGTQLPALTRALLSLSDFIRQNLLQMVLVTAIIVIGSSIYIRTPKGKYQMDKFILKIPLLGRITHLKELGRCCRSISLLFRAGLPLTEILPLVIDSTKNKAIIEALQEVHQDMLKGEGLSRPMAKNKLFLPMMVQMVKVGEETGSLDATILAVAESYETEAKDKSDAVIALIQPTMTVIIGGIIGVIALSMVSAMYSMYGQAF